MPLVRRTLLVLFALAALFAVPAAAAADDALVLATAAETETTDAPANESGIVPAVEADTSGGEAAEQPWTARFLAPLLLTIGIVGLVTSLIAYVTRVKARYRVVH